MHLFRRRSATRRLAAALLAAVTISTTIGLQVTAAGDIYLGKSSTYYTRNLTDPLGATGRWYISLFIQRAEVSHPAGTLKGDNRGFGYDCWRSRACIVLDFTSSPARISFTIRPSCGRGSDGYKCVSAHPVNGGFGTNGVSISEILTGTSKGHIQVDWDLNQSRYGYLPGGQLNGRLDINPPKVQSGWSAGVRMYGDGFPSVEMYFSRPNLYKTIVRRNEGVPEDLFPIVGDWTDRWLWP